MTRLKSLTCLFTAASGLCAVVALDSPQCRLWIHTATRKTNCRPVPVDAFSPAGFHEDSVPVSLGALRLSVPRAAMVQREPGDRPDAERVGLSLQWAGMGLVAFSPVPNQVSEYEQRLYRSPPSLGQLDAVALRGAAFSADPTKASLWMDRRQAQELDSLLAIRTFLFCDVERVELVRGEAVKGVLIIRDLGDDRMSMVFDFFSLDESLSGTAILTLDRRSEYAINTARAIVSSFHVASDSIAEARLCCR
jgi:hypothetical protein